MTFSQQKKTQLCYLHLLPSSYTTGFSQACLRKKQDWVRLLAPKQNQKMDFAYPMPPKHLAPSLMASPPPRLQRQILYHSLSHTAKEHRSFTKAERGAEKKPSLNPVIVPRFMLALMHPSCEKIFPTLQSESPRVQYKLTNPCNFLVRQATEYLFLQGTRK